MTNIPDDVLKSEYMDDAIRAANALRLELGRKVPGPLTVAPHVALKGGVVSVHMAHTQASHLAHIVHEYKPTEPVEKDPRVQHHPILINQVRDITKPEDNFHSRELTGKVLVACGCGVDYGWTDRSEWPEERLRKFYEEHTYYVESASII